MIVVPSTMPLKPSQKPIASEAKAPASPAVHGANSPRQLSHERPVRAGR